MRRTGPPEVLVLEEVPLDEAARAHSLLEQRAVLAR